MRSHRLSIAAAAVAALALLPLAAPAVAQGIGPQANSVTSPIPAPEAVTLQAKITAINPQTRRITLTGAHGNTVRVTAGHAVDLSRLKVGDTVNAQVLPFGRVLRIGAGRRRAGRCDRAGGCQECYASRRRRAAGAADQRRRRRH